jgi:D-glycero-alpha-D-manno-heptose-7-phosphate kinase
MIISRTPLRMSFVGGGSDLKAYYQNHYGAVVSTAINKYVYVIVLKKFDDYIRVGYSTTELVEDVRDIKHNIIRESLKLVGGIETSIDIVYMADVLPLKYGTGLGVSSSIAVGVLNALYAYKGEHVSAEILAQQACKIEIDILGAPIGKQDQYAAAYGGFNYIRFNNDESVLVEPLFCDKLTKDQLSRRLLLFYTGLDSNSEAILTEQKANTYNNKDIKETLRSMVKTADKVRTDLEQNNIDRLGHTLHQGWLAKSALASNITNSRIDDWYKKALNAGAVGGKILGSGGGGFLLIFCEEKYQDAVRQTLSVLKEIKFNFESDGSKIIYNSRETDSTV